MSSINLRVVLWMALGLALYLNYTAWQRDYGVQPTTAAHPNGASGVSAPSLGATVPSGVPHVAEPKAPAAAATPAVERATVATPATLKVRTDVLALEISLQGGELRQADVLRYPKVKNRPEDVVRLLNRDSRDTMFVLQSGLAGPAGTDAPYPTHLATFSSPEETYTLAPGSAELRVPLVWSDGHGVQVTKTYVFHRGSYAIDVDYRVENAGDAPWSAAVYAQLLRHNEPVERSMFSPDTYAFKGPAYYDGTKYQKLRIDNAEDRKLSREITGGWLAALQHHFVAAIVPAAGVPYHYTLRSEDREYLLTAVGPQKIVPAHSSETFETQLFIGPKLQAQLKTAGPRLDLVADYGRLTLLAEPLFWLLSKVHGLVGNWGWAIVIVTFLLKLVFYPLSEASGRSMAKMKALSPRIKNLQETHKDDREKLGRAMMDLYKREKINPAAGCLPMLVQIPVFLAFYWVLLESVEMRQAPFMGWINDLSSRDPLFILPAIMAAAMFAQYKLNPAPPDPVQAKVFMIMPLAMSVMFAFFPAGLVLYWVTNTVLSIAQQWNINRRIETQRAASGGARRP
ncbi:MAG: membrane protein insertase YidC [Gammaproteobacteria bacterium]|nr:membrane protein insertase YidC [Gammaproteobacteria bacterium]